MADRRPPPLLEGLNAALRLSRWAGVLAGLAILYTGVDVVQPDEVALRLRCGRLTGATRAAQVHGPGLLLSLPALIDEVVKVPVKRVREMRIDALRSRRALAFKRVDITQDGYALTGDSNLIQPEVLLKYQILDPVEWALRRQDPEAMVRDAVVAALTRTLAEMKVDQVLVEGKRQLAAEATRRAQARLDEPPPGRPRRPWVQLVALEFTALQPPVQVEKYFNDVQKAIVEKKTLEEKARSYAARELPLAEAARSGQIREAEAYESRVLAEARGRADAFLELLGEYRQDPGVVRRRLYFEAVEEVMKRGCAVTLLPAAAGRYRILIQGEVLRLEPPGARH